MVAFSAMGSFRFFEVPQFEQQGDGSSARFAPISERSQTFEAQGLAAAGVGQVQPMCVQEQPRLGRRAVRPVKCVAHNRVAERLQMHPQLVRPTGDRLEQQPGGLGLAFQDLPAGLAGSALVFINPLSGPLRPVGRQGQIDSNTIIAV